MPLALNSKVVLVLNLVLVVQSKARSNECVNIFIIQTENIANKNRQSLSQPKPWCNDSGVLNLHHDYYLTLVNRAGGLYGENLDRGRKYRPNAVRSVHTTEVKILPYRPT